MKKERKKIPLKIKVITVLIFLLIAVLAFLKAEGVIFSKIQTDENDKYYSILYNGNRYRYAHIGNYVVIRDVLIEKHGIIVEPASYYTSCHDEEKNIIIKDKVCGDCIYLKEGVTFDINTVPTGMIVYHISLSGSTYKPVKSIYIQHKNIMNKLEHIINYCEKYPSEHTTIRGVGLGVCYSNLPIGINNEAYYIYLCEDECWVVEDNDNGEMYKIIDEEVIEFLNDFISEED